MIQIFVFSQIDCFTECVLNKQGSAPQSNRRTTPNMKMCERRKVFSRDDCVKDVFFPTCFDIIRVCVLIKRTEA